MARRYYSRRYPKYVRKALRAANKQKVAKTVLKSLLGPRGEPKSVDFWGKTYKEASPQQQALRSALNFRGQGDYFSDLWANTRKYIPRGLGGAIGLATGAGWGAGWGAGKSFSKNILGWGDYGNGPTQSNQLIQGGGQPISVNSSGDLSGDIWITHREFVTNVQANVQLTGGATSGYSSFNNVTYPINAALVQTFPWLSQIAENFTLYQFFGLVFEYRPTSGEFGTTGTNALGKVVMATQYDSYASPFSSSVQMENYDYSTSCKPSCGMIHGVETKPSQAQNIMYYTRIGVSNKPINDTDLGSFQIATEGVPLSGAANANITANIGELWVSYTVKLSRAALVNSILDNGGASAQLVAFPSNGTMTGATVSNVGASTAAQYYNYVGDQAAQRKTNTLAITITPVNTVRQQVRITFPPSIIDGYFLIIMEYDSSNNGVSTVSPSFDQYTNCSVATIPGTFGADAGLGTVGQVASSGGNYPPLSTTILTTAQHFASHVLVRIQAPGNSVASVRWSIGPYNSQVGDRFACVITQLPQMLTI